MWKLVFLVTWLGHAVLGDSAESLKSVDSLETDLEKEFDRISEELLSSLIVAHSQTLNRKKRALTSDQPKSFVDEIGVYRLQTITPVGQLCHPAIYSKFVDVGKTTYAICVSAETQESPAEVLVGVYEEHVWKPITRWFVVRPNGLSAFYFKGFIYVLIADGGKVEGTDLVKINVSSYKTVVDHIVYSRPATSNSIWKMKVDGKFHMAIANSPEHSNDLISEVFTYEWMDTYFDKYASLRAYDVRDIEPFHIHDMPYLAIANYRSSINNFEVDSEIFRYNLEQKGWISHQKIRTYGATDWEFFALGSGISREFFLAVANKENNEVSEVKSMIYKFAKDMFVPFQCIPSPRVSSIASWSTKYAFLMAVASMDDAVHLYQYDGWRFVESGVQYTQRSMSYGVNSLIFHNISIASIEVPILSVSNPEYSMERSIYEMGFKHENALKAWTEKSTEWCFNTLQRVETTDTDALIRALDDVLFTDQVSPIVIEGNLRFENGFDVGKLQTPMLKEIVTQEVYDSSMLLKLEDINKRLQAVDVKVQKFEEVIKNSLKTEGNQTITGHLKFQDVVFDCEKYACNFDSINTTFLNGEDISDWSNNLIFTDGDHIPGTLMADSINANSITVSGLVDGVDSKTLVTKSGNHHITGYKTFVNPIAAKEIEVHGKVDGLEISPSNVLLSTGHQNITGNLVFDEIETSWLEVNGYVNGVDLSKFYDDVVRSDQPATITGEKTFHNIVVDELRMDQGSKINGVDLADLWANTLWKNGDQVIKAPFTFQSVDLKKNLHAPLGINGINIPGPRVVDINDFANVTVPITFKGPTKMAHLEVLNSLNGLGMYSVEGSSPQLDIMLKSGNQVITGRKTFHTIHLDADSIVKGTVDGVDLSELKAIALRRDSTIDTNRTWVFNNLVIKGPLTVGKISGHDINSIYERALKLTDKEVPEIIFKDVIHIDELESYDINGINIKNDLVLINEPQVLTGTKIFREIVLEDNSIVVGTINNVNVTFLNETILRVGNQVLKSKVFNRNVKMNKLTVKGSINNVPIEEFVTLTGEDSILHARELRNVTFHEIEAKNLEVAGNVNGINVEDMIKNTLTYEGPQEVKGNVNVKGTIYVVPGKDLKVGNIDGVNITELWEDAVLSDVPQEISGEKVFTDSVVFKKLDFKDTIDGVSEWDMQNWMLRDEYQVVEGDITFTNDLSVDNLQVNGLINNINLTELNASIVKTNEPSVIEGPVIFESVISTGDITLTGKIQGVDLSEEAVTKSGDKVVTGVKTFTQDLLVDGDVSVDGLVDGVSIADVCEKTLLVKKEQNISHITIKGDVTLIGGASVGGKVAGMDLAELRKVATFDESSVTISGPKVFRNLTIDGPVKIEGMFGGVNLQDLLQNYMSLTRDQNISGAIEFEEVHFNGTLTAKNFYSQNNLVNGIDIRNLNDRILKTDGTQTVTAKHHFDEIVFADDVFVAGKVNGLDVPGGLMRRDKANYIQSPKIFKKPVRVLGDLDMDSGKLIQGVDVSEWNKKAVLNDGGSYEIRGLKTFKNLTVTDAKVEGLLDGVKISEDTLLMTYGDQVVTGQKTVKGNVEVVKSLTVNGLINNVDLDYLSSNTLQKDKVNTVTGEKHFTKPLTISHLEAPTVAGVDVMELQRKINTRLDFEHVQNRLEEIDGVITSMKEAIRKQAVLFQYYELFQEFNIPRAYSWYYLFNKDCGELLLLSDNSSHADSCSSIRIFNYNQEKQIFLPHPQELPASFATSVKSLLIEDKTFLFVANLNPKSCSKGQDPEGEVTSDIYEWNGEAFTLFQTIPMMPIVHMEVFTDGHLWCVIYIELRSSTVYCTEGKDEDFTYQETLPTVGCRKASIIQSHGKIILVIASEDLRPRTGYYIDDKPVDIYIWNSETATFSTPVQSISSTYVQSLLLMSHFNDYSYDLFLAIGEGKIPKIQNEPKISIYRYDESTKQFLKYQELKENGELEWLVLTTGELILFILDMPNGNIKLYQLKGASGFVLVDTVHSIGTVSMHAFIRRMDPEDNINHYLALAGPRAIMAQPSQGPDYAKILKSKIKGRRYFINP